MFFRKLCYLTFSTLILTQTSFAEVYRWTDQAGVTHYSDRPQSPSAKQIELPPAQTYTAPKYETASPEETTLLDPNLAETALDYTISVVSPKNEANYSIGDSQTIPVIVQVKPTLMEGLSIRIRVDGEEIPFNEGDMSVEGNTYSFILPRLNRGKHQLTASIVAKLGHTTTAIAQSPAVTFYSQQASRLSPARTTPE